jgi:hypothetical protein
VHGLVSGGAGNFTATFTDMSPAKPACIPVQGTGSGIYTVNSDCTGSASFTSGAAAGVTFNPVVIGAGQRCLALTRLLSSSLPPTSRSSRARKIQVLDTTLKAVAYEGTNKPSAWSLKFKTLSRDRVRRNARTVENEERLHQNHRLMQRPERKPTHYESKEPDFGLELQLSGVGGSAPDGADGKSSVYIQLCPGTQNGNPG